MHHRIVAIWQGSVPSYIPSSSLRHTHLLLEVFFLFFRFWLLGFLALGFWLLGFLASWLFGFLASWLLGFLASWLLASWLLGFLAFWLLGFLAFRLLGFLALAFRILCSQFLFGRWHFGFCGFSLVYAAFGGFSFLHPLLSQFLSGLFGFCTLSLFFGCGFPHHQHHQFLPI